MPPGEVHYLYAAVGKEWPTECHRSSFENTVLHCLFPGSTKFQGRVNRVIDVGGDEMRVDDGDFILVCHLSLHLLIQGEGSERSYETAFRGSGAIPPNGPRVGNGTLSFFFSEIRFCFFYSGAMRSESASQ